MKHYTFIIPVYNCKAYLPGCVDSIRAVGAEDYEILLVDDGSTDGSGAVCDELAGKFPEIRVIHQPNAGASAARNRGIREAAGRWILFLDGDDCVDSAALGEVLADQRTRESDLTVFGLTFDYHKNGKCYRRDPLFYETDGVLSRQAWGENFTQLYGKNAWSSSCTKIFKKAILDEYGIRQDESMFLYEDFEFVLRYLAHCDTVRNVPRAIYHYRQSEDEGNAGRRLKRIPSLPEFLQPIEAALRNLSETVSERDRAMVLQQLHLTLAREKIAVSGIDTIGTICRDYQKWAENRLLPLEPDKFQTLLRESKAYQLYLRNQKTQLRHWVAVRVKAMLKQGQPASGTGK